MTKIDCQLVENPAEFPVQVPVPGLHPENAMAATQNLPIRTVKDPEWDWDWNVDSDESTGAEGETQVPIASSLTEALLTLQRVSTHSATASARNTTLEIKSDHAEVRGFELHRIHSIAFELNYGDTLVFIDYPEPPPNSKYLDCHCIAFNSQRFRMPSEKLLATGSSKFKEMLESPTYQFRIKRRRKLVNKLPDGVKFVIDLTPPTEGDDLVFQMTELSLTPGIMKWWMAQSKFDTDGWLCMGHDDVCSCWARSAKASSVEVPATPPESIISPKEEKLSPIERRQLDMAIMESVKDMGTRKKSEPCAEGASEVVTKNEHGDLETPRHLVIPDYCPIRHRNNIIRLLMMIAGDGNNSILLDSAARVWTLVGVAKILDCPFVVRDRVCGWLMESTNSKFIEVLPEETLQIAYTLQLPQVTRAAFSILVNEWAFDEAATDAGPRKASPLTVFGRKRQDVSDDLSNLIQHASRALVTRITRLVNQLRSENLLTELGLPEWLNLLKLKELLSERDEHYCRAALESLKILLNALSSQIPGDFDASLRKYDLIKGIDRDRAAYVDIREFVLFDIVYLRFNPVQKALCPFVYQELEALWQPSPFVGFSRLNRVDFFRLVDDFRQDMRTAVQKDAMLFDQPEWMQYRDFGGLCDRMALEEQVRSSFTDKVTQCWLRHEIDPPLNMTRHMLLTLEQNELKYLPLWAGGNNDGTGGVFEEALPPAAYGPNGPGPAYHTGMTVPSDQSDASSITGSITQHIRDLKFGSGSTAGPGSVDVQDSISTVYNPHEVIADDVSIKTESFTDGEDEFAHARFAVPADHQGVAQGLEMMVDWESESTTEMSTGSVVEDDGERTPDAMSDIEEDESDAI